MPQLSDYELHQIDKSIKEINKVLSDIEYLSNKNSFDYSRLQRKIKQYSDDANQSQKYVERSIKELTNGSGIFFRKDGINNLFSKNFDLLNSKINELNSNYRNKFDELFSNIGKLTYLDISNSISLNDDNDLFVFPTINENDNDEDEKENIADIADETVTNDNKLLDENYETNEAVTYQGTTNQQNLVSNIAEILASDKTGKDVPKKKIIIRKNTPLDNDEIKQLFINRNLRYELNLSQINEGIKFAGNDVDKNKILLGAMYAKYKDDLANNDFFYILKDIDLLLEFLEDNKDESLDLLFGKFFLLVSGWGMAHSHHLSRRSFDILTIDPRLATRQIVELNTTLQYDELTLIHKFENSKYTLLLSNALKESFYDVPTAAKIMLVSYKHPNDFIKCSDLGFKRIN
ncbi:hypothetical protein ACUZ9N_01455 [Mycoplasmopsis gallinarum]